MTDTPGNVLGVSLCLDTDGVPNTARREPECLPWRRAQASE